MIQNKNIIKNIVDTTQQVIMPLSMAAMTAGIMLSLVEVPDHGRVVLPNQQTFSPVGALSNEENNPVRRERGEESAPHYISYSEAERTPSRSGRS
mgnify:CR=1 FL=1